MDDHRGAPPEKLSLTRKQLYDMVWSTPMLRLARTFQCSSTWLARICRESAVPVPPRGYWAKKRAGKAARRLPLRRSADPDEVVVSYTSIEEKDETPAPPPPPPPPPLDEDLAALRAQVEQAGPISIAAAFERLHPVVARTDRALRQAERQKRDRHGLLQPQWVHEGCLLGIEVSATGIDRAIRLFEGLFVAGEAFGGKVVEKDKSPAIRLLGDRVKFHLRERPRMRRLTPEEMKDRWAGRISWEGSGVFELAVSTDDELGSQKRWRDGRKGQIEDRLQRILLDTIEAIQAGRRWRRAAPARELERQRRLEEERQRQIEQFRRDEERRRERERVTFLTELAAQHAKATQLRNFLAACKEVPDRDGAADRWIAWGEAVLAGIDPLADGLAPILAARPAYGPPLFAAITGEAADAP
jgi:hypothetical protein